MTNIYRVPQPKFPLGELYVTAAVDKTLAPENIQAAPCAMRGAIGAT
jgi:hypothetical protein